MVAKEDLDQKYKLETAQKLIVQAKNNVELYDFDEQQLFAYLKAIYDLELETMWETQIFYKYVKETYGEEALNEVRIS